MTRLVEALEGLGLTGEFSLAGHWVKIQGERCPVYVVEARWEHGFYTWCDEPCDDLTERAVETFVDPRDAILAGLRRAAWPAQPDRRAG